MADRHGATVVDFWRMREYRDMRMWDTDRIHMSPLGHARMALAVLDVLGVDHDLVHEVLDPLPEVPRREAREATIAWVRGFAMPWVGRRLRGRSSGDELLPAAPPSAAPDLGGSFRWVGCENCTSQALQRWMGATFAVQVAWSGSPAGTAPRRPAAHRRRLGRIVRECVTGSDSDDVMAHTRPATRRSGRGHSENCTSRAL